MRPSIGPKWVLISMKNLSERGVDLYNFDDVVRDLQVNGEFDVVEWIRSNRSLYNVAVLNSQHLLIDFYHD